LGREFEDSFEELFVPAIEGWLLRLAGHVEHAKHGDDENRDGSQNGHRHVPRPLSFVHLRLRSVDVVTLAPVDAERHGEDLDDRWNAGLVARSPEIVGEHGRVCLPKSGIRDVCVGNRRRSEQPARRRVLTSLSTTMMKKFLNGKKVKFDKFFGREKVDRR